ncbi:MAG: hypothetical protein ACOCXV_01030 [Bacteroidota bacterium]
MVAFQDASDSALVHFINRCGNQITIVGKTRHYVITDELEYVDDYYSILRGEQELHFSDFHLEPPQKGPGMVKVNNSLKVSFKLFLEKATLSEK